MKFKLVLTNIIDFILKILLFSMRYLLQNSFSQNTCLILSDEYMPLESLIVSSNSQISQNSQGKFK